MRLVDAPLEAEHHEPGQRGGQVAGGAKASGHPFLVVEEGRWHPGLGELRAGPCRREQREGWGRHLEASAQSRQVRVPGHQQHVVKAWPRSIFHEGEEEGTSGVIEEEQLSAEQGDDHHLGQEGYLPVARHDQGYSGERGHHHHLHWGERGG